MEYIIISIIASIISLMTIFIVMSIWFDGNNSLWVICQKIFMSILCVILVISNIELWNSIPMK